MKKITVTLALVLVLTVLLPGCKKVENEYVRYTDSFFDVFNTLTQVIGYTKSEEEFYLHFEKIHARLQELHKLYDIYNSYEGINNIKTINDNAGIKPVKVDRELVDLILFAKDWYYLTEGRTNIALGPVLKIWHDYRAEAIYEPQNAKLPPMEILRAAASHTDIEKIIVDTENSTVYLADSRMRLDIGAVAKGFAVELVAKEIFVEGMISGVINAGGNIRVIGQPLDSVRDRWAIGIQNPDASIVAENDNILDTVFISDASVVSSGDYQRYYMVGDEVIHHIIDPLTLMPGTHYRSITVLAVDSGVADFLSTELFLIPYKESRALADSIAGVEAIWVMPDGKVEATDGMKQILRSSGATNRIL